MFSLQLQKRERERERGGGGLNIDRGEQKFVLFEINKTQGQTKFG